MKPKREEPKPESPKLRRLRQMLSYFKIRGDMATMPLWREVSGEYPAVESAYGKYAETEKRLRADVISAFELEIGRAA